METEGKAGMRVDPTKFLGKSTPLAPIILYYISQHDDDDADDAESNRVPEPLATSALCDTKI